MNDREWIKSHFVRVDARFGGEWDIPWEEAEDLIAHYDRLGREAKGKGGLEQLVAPGGGDYYLAITDIAKMTKERLEAS